MRDAVGKHAGAVSSKDVARQHLWITSITIHKVAKEAACIHGGIGARHLIESNAS